MAKVLIETEGTEFEQNMADLAMIDNKFREGKPTMISSADLDEAFTNASQDVKDKISFDVNGEERTVTPTTSKQVLTPSQGKNAMTKVTVNAVTSAIDANIVAGNIKKDVTILGVTGTHEGGSQLQDVVAGTKYKTLHFIPVGTEVSDSTFCSNMAWIMENYGSSSILVDSILTYENGTKSIGVNFTQNSSSDGMLISFYDGLASGAKTDIRTIYVEAGSGAVGYCNICALDNAGLETSAISYFKFDSEGITVSTASTDATYRAVALYLLKAYASDIIAS